jgi:hypothetical protein
VYTADNLHPSCACSLEILGASTSWRTKSLSRPVTGLLYLQLALNVSKVNNNFQTFHNKGKAIVVGNTEGKKKRGFWK